MSQDFHAHCASCGSRWSLNPPGTRPMAVEQAVQVMTAGICPTCRNDGTKAPIRWKVKFTAREAPSCRP